MKVIPMIIVAAFVLMGASECDGTDQGADDNRKDAVSQRQANFDRAEAMWPAPTDLSNFPLRRALVEFTRRQDLINHPWYIYIMGMNGEPVGYFVGQTYPISTCNFLSSTDQFVDLPDSVWGGPISAPSYDGIFYGGGGSSAACQGFFFFDVTTNAMHTFVAPFWFASDQPLNLDVGRIGTEGHVNEVAPADVPATPSDPEVVPTETPTEEG